MSAIINLIFGWFGIATLIGCGAVAVAIFTAYISAIMPAPLAFLTANLRHYAILVAIAAFSFTAVSGKYFHDGLAFKQAQWDAAVQAAIDKGTKARSDAERDTPDDPAGGVRDPDQRD